MNIQFIEGNKTHIGFASDDRVNTMTVDSKYIGITLINPLETNIDKPLTPEEKISLAKEMIVRWEKYSERAHDEAIKMRYNGEGFGDQGQIVDRFKSSRCRGHEGD